MIVYLHGDVGSEAHELLMLQAFQMGYESTGGVWGGEIRQRSGSLNSALVEAVGAGAKFVVRGYNDAINNLTLANHYYPNVTLAMPPGTGSQEYTGAIPAAMLFISGGDSGVNETGGNTEFVVNDPLTSESVVDELDRQDYALAFGTGQLAFIVDQVSGSVWDARARAQATGTNNGSWDNVRGYGAINVNDAIAYNLGVAPDPFFTPGNITLTRTQNIVDGILDPIPNANSYNIYRNNVLQFNTTSLSFQDSLTGYGLFDYQYAGVSNGLESAKSSVFTVDYPNPNTVYHDRKTYLGPTPSGSEEIGSENNGRFYLRSEKYITEALIRILRRLFRNTGTIYNKDLEYFNTGSGSVPGIYEQYFEEPETYPVITVLATGGASTAHGIDRHITTVTNDGVQLGERGLSMVVITNSAPLVFKTPSLKNETIHKLALQMAWTGVGVEGSIDIKIFKNYTTTPELVHQLTKEVEITTGLQDVVFDLSTGLKFSDEDVWIEVSTTVSGGYIIAIDPNAANVYTFDGTTSDGSPVGFLGFPPFIRSGGNRESTAIVRCMAKNDSGLCRTYAEFIETSLQTLLAAQLSRKDYNVAGAALAKLDTIGATEWGDYEIYLKSSRSGTIEVRERGPNDKIFTVPVNLELFSSWFRDYPALDISNIDLDVQNYD